MISRYSINACRHNREANQPKVNTRPYITMLSILFTDILLCLSYKSIVCMAVEIMGFCVNIYTSRVRQSLHLTRPTGTDKRMNL